MGAACARLADRLVVTSDNPRSEDPLAIIDAIMEGVRGEASGRAAEEAGHVYVVPSDLDSWEYPCIASAIGTIWMAGKMYPELISDAEVEKYVLDFYKDIYGVTLTREQLNF